MGLPGKLHAAREWIARTVSSSAITGDIYHKLYETHAKVNAGDDATGDGSFDIIGQIERDVLIAEGLAPSHTLLDFGCGVGRLAVHAIPMLDQGCYIGTDIAETFLARARQRIAVQLPQATCATQWLHQTGPHYPVADASVDMICAFSVFTHMEHEDAYLYFKDARRIIKPGGKFVFSCLPLSLKDAQPIFLAETAVDLRTRWTKVRNVATSKDFMETIARLAGWTPARWYDGDTPNISSRSGELRALGQSTCVLLAAEG